MKKQLANTQLFALFVFAALAWTIWADDYFFSSVLTPDGVSYLRMAEAAAHGHLFNPNGLMGSPGWFARWPLGYPWLLALTMQLTGTDAFTAGRLVATAMVGGLLVLLLCRARAAFPLLALALLNLSFAGLVRPAYSEQPYLVILTALGFTLSDAQDGPHTLLRLAVLCLTAFLFRYVGAFTAGWAILTAAGLWWLGRQNGPSIRSTLTAAVLAGMFVAGYLLLNHAMCGAFTGGHQPGTSEPFLSLARRACLALVNESQMFAFCLFWTATFFAVLGRKAFRRKRDKNSPATSDGWAFIFLGLLCNGTMLVLRFILPFDTLGFRLLCPGTTLLTFGLILHVRNRLDADWSAALDAVPIRRFLALLTVLAIPATHLTAIEYGIRHVLNLPADALHAPYRTMRARLTAAYADRPAGARLSVPSCQDENFWINFLRPDLLADADDLPEKGF